jgi:anti-anti-sigma regulatory factor
MEHHPTSPVHVESLEGSSPETAILKITGPLTIHNFFDFQDLARQQTAPVFIIDLTDVPYIDSAALGSLVGEILEVEKIVNGKRAGDLQNSGFRRAAF